MLRVPPAEADGCVGWVWWRCWVGRVSLVGGCRGLGWSRCLWCEDRVSPAESDSRLGSGGGCPPGAGAAPAQGMSNTRVGAVRPRDYDLD